MVHSVIVLPTMSTIFIKNAFYLKILPYKKHFMFIWSCVLQIHRATLIEVQNTNERHSIYIIFDNEIDILLVDKGYPQAFIILSTSIPRVKRDHNACIYSCFIRDIQIVTNIDA